MIKVVQVTVFNIFVSYLILRVSPSFDDRGSVGELIARLFLVHCTYILYGAWQPNGLRTKVTT